MKWTKFDEKSPDKNWLLIIRFSSHGYWNYHIDSYKGMNEYGLHCSDEWAFNGWSIPPDSEWIRLPRKKSYNNKEMK